MHRDAQGSWKRYGIRARNQRASRRKCIHANGEAPVIFVPCVQQIWAAVVRVSGLGTANGRDGGMLLALVSSVLG